MILDRWKFVSCTPSYSVDLFWILFLPGCARFQRSGLFDWGQGWRWQIPEQKTYRSDVGLAFQSEEINEIDLLELWQVKLQSCGQSGQVFVLLPIRWSNMIKRRPKEHLWSDQKKGWAFFGSWAMENGHLFCKIAFFAILEFSNTLWVSMIQFLCGASRGSTKNGFACVFRGTGWIFAGVPILLVWLGFRVLSEIRWISSE